MSYDIQIGLATPSEEADIRSRRHRPPYSLESFLEWEEEAAGRGATQWVMYKDMESQTTPESKSHSIDRTVMGSFQTIPRRALVASRGADGQVQVDKVSCSLIQSMFVFEEFRRQGLAATALRLIKDQLESYAEADHGNIKFLYLYSYVGPELYTQGGWTSFPATYATLPTVVSSPETAPAPGDVELFDVKKVERLCQRDEELVRDELLQSYTSDDDATPKFVVLADWPAISWLEACEEHVARETNTGALSLKGARARTRAGTVWCIWTRIFRGNGEIDFQILRSRVDAAAANDNSELSAKEAEDQVTSGLAAVLRAAQLEAGRWGCNNVTMKNPPPRLVRAAQRIDPSAQSIPRVKICLPFLHWYGGAEGEETPEWLQNESHGDF